MKTLILLLISANCFGQVVYNVGGGLSLNASSVNAMAEVGGRVGSLAYFGVQTAVRSSGYPTVSLGAVIGAAWSWNNRKMHELTTVFYMKADPFTKGNEGYTADPPTTFGAGIRHYIYNAFVDASWQHSQVQLTLGYSFGNIYK